MKVMPLSRYFFKDVTESKKKEQTGYQQHPLKINGCKSNQVPKSLLYDQRNFEAKVASPKIRLKK